MKNQTIRIPKALSNPKYMGKHLVLVEGKVMAAGTWTKISGYLDKIYKQGKRPLLTYIPKADSLILFHA